jgi:ubiquinone/menaquinone biosynthesis C-methylase UbiE
MNPADLGELFDAGHADFSHTAPVLWDPIGAATVAAVRLREGERVLDACCGAGASALPAGTAVGLSGRVDAVDLAPGLLAQGRARAAEAGLDHVRFARADVTQWSPPDGVPYDLLLCVHGIFFLPDMDASARRLAGLIRPGGRFTVTVWEKGALERYAHVLHDCVARERGATESEGPVQAAIKRIHEEQALRTWLSGLGLREVETVRLPLDVPLTADLAWKLVTGTGFRAMLTGLSAEAVARIREDLLDTLDREGVHSLDAASILGIGTVPPTSP